MRGRHTPVAAQPPPYTTGSAIKLELAGQADNLAPGVVMGVADDGVVTARFNRTMPMIQDMDATIRYQGPSHRFMAQAVRILEIEQANGQPILRFIPADTPSYGERREAFRIRVAAQRIAIRLGKDLQARLEDISADGVGVSIDGPAADLRAGNVVPFAMKCRDETIRGELLVQHVRTPNRPGTPTHIGLAAMDEEVRRRFVKVVMSAQRRMLSCGPDKQKTRTDQAKETGDDVWQDAEEQAIAIDRRQYSRVDFGAHGRIYMRQQQIMRILPAMTHNLSRGGMGILTNQYIHPGTSVILEVQTDVISIHIVGDVCYCQLDDETRHRVGISFHKMPQKHPIGGEDALPNELSELLDQLPKQPARRASPRL